jgi:hypothetical protein
MENNRKLNKTRVEMKFLEKAFKNKLISVFYYVFWHGNKFVNFIGIFQAASGKGKLFVPSNIQGMILIKFFSSEFFTVSVIGVFHKLCWVCELQRNRIYGNPSRLDYLILIKFSSTFPTLVWEIVLNYLHHVNFEAFRWFSIIKSYLLEY